MPQVAKGRSRIALIAALATLASLFAFAAPAVAATGDVESPADFSACVAAATDDAGFGDTAGSFADASIDCIFHYGITTGTSAGVYSPGDVVTREQMALFLIRAAGPAGITVPAATNQNLTDIGGLPQASQDAINQLVALGISTGTTTTTYSPADPVARYQMALFLIRFLDEAGVDFDGTSASGLTDTTQVSVEAFNAIEDAYDLGITTGTTATTFSPFDAVTREQMAAFIARTLAHTNARPAGISFQASETAITVGDSVDLQISVRDSSFAPVVDGLVDVFGADLEDKADALNSDGTCDTLVVSAAFGGTVCEIELGEPTSTDANGNIEATVSPAADVIWWAWTGDAGDEFDVDDFAVVAVEVTVGAAATHLIITDDTADTAVAGNATSFDPSVSWENGGLLKFGDSVTLTFQLADAADGDPVALAGETFELGFSRSVDDAYKGDTIVELTTDANGTATYTFTESDPSSTANNAAIIEWYINDDGGYIDIDDTPASFNQDYVFEDDAAVATTLELDSTTDYVAASDSGSGAANIVTATLTDQYGDPVSGEGIEFVSDDADGIGVTAISRTTNSSGVATLGYNRDAATSSLEVVDAEEPDNAISAASLNQYWTLGPAPDGTYETDGGAVPPTALDIVIVDTDNKTVVVNYDPDTGTASDDDYWTFVWDASDQFRDTGAPVSMADFEDDLTDNDELSIVWDADAVSAFDITTDNA